MNAPCKHIIYITSEVFHIKESSHILQQIYLAKKEIKNLLNVFVSKKAISVR